MRLIERIAQASAELQAAQVAFGHGTTNAQDEACWLVLHALGLPLDTPLGPEDEASHRLLTPTQLAQVATLLGARINTRKPAAYLTGEAWLQGFAFYVDERVIVPRSLIAELLVDGSVDYWLHAHTQRVLDLCTGNGSLGIVAAHLYPDISVTAADISADALEVARINVARHGLQDRIQLVQSDGLQQLQGPFDWIICNPPYVNAHSMASLPPEYHAEPAIALDGNQEHGSGDGMDFIRPLLAQAPDYLSADGVLVLEIGNERAFFEAAFPQLQPIWLETSAGDEQVLLLTRAALLAAAPHPAQPRPTA